METSKLRSLPGGGAGFDAGKFASRFKSATKYTLRDKSAGVAKVIGGSAAAIRAGRFNSQRAWGKIDKKDLTYKDKLDIKQVLKHLEKTSSLSASRQNSNQGQESSSEVVPDRIKRANILSAGRAYEEAQKLGGGTAAQNIQKKALERLKSLDADAAKEALGGGRAINTGLAGSARSGNPGFAGSSRVNRSGGLGASNNLNRGGGLDGSSGLASPGRSSGLNRLSL